MKAPLSASPSTPGQNDKHLPGLLFLGALGYFLAAVSLLASAADPQNAVFLGYSGLRLFVFALTLFPGCLLLALAIQKMRGRVLFLETALTHKAQHPTAWALGCFVAALLGFWALAAPPALFGPVNGAFERLQPLLAATGLFAVEVLFWLRLPEPGWNRAAWKTGVAALAFVALFCGTIFVTRWGLIPDGGKWNNAAIPLTMFQLTSLLTVSALMMLVFARWRWQDTALYVLLWAAAFWAWGNTPMRAGYFSTPPAAPYFQAFPASDARIHDVGALSILNGWGIYGGAYTDKPLYMVFLAGLHLLARYDYNLLALLQTGVLALMVPMLYLLGKWVHSRAVGLALALVMLVRQVNAILLANALVFNANPRLLMTEIPTTLGFILITLLVFVWMTRPDKFPWLPFFTGGALGMLSLIRLNPAFLLPAVPVIVLFSLWRNKKKWFLQSIQFGLGFILLIVPWIFTGQDASGQPYFFIKFMDVIQSRYGAELPPAAQIAALDGYPLGAQPGASADWIDSQRFPGFVFNHFFYNAVSSFLALPDSFQPTDQELAALVQHPAWSNGQVQVDAGQVPFLAFNLLMIATGLGLAWRRWHWAGLSFLMLFFAYSLSLALGRTSGSRYVPPIDWIFFFYYLLGLAALLKLFPSALRIRLQAEFATAEATTLTGAASPRWRAVTALGLVFLAAISLPAADNLIPRRADLCQREHLAAGLALAGISIPLEQLTLEGGQALYPVVGPGGETVTLLTCGETRDITVPGFKQKLALGDVLIAGWSQEKTLADTVLLVSLAGAQPQILWQAGP